MLKDFAVAIVFSGMLGVLVVGNAQASAQDSAQDWHEQEHLWQLELLFEPGNGQLKREGRGGIFIYSDLKDTVVDRAMDEQFDRIETMMFVRTVSTDVDGEVEMIAGPDGTLVALVEEDGC